MVVALRFGRSYEKASMLDRYREDDDFDDMDLEWSEALDGSSAGVGKGGSGTLPLKHKVG